SLHRFHLTPHLKRALLTRWCSGRRGYRCGLDHIGEHRVNWNRCRFYLGRDVAQCVEVEFTSPTISVGRDRPIHALREERIDQDSDAEHYHAPNQKLAQWADTTALDYSEIVGAHMLS